MMLRRLAFAALLAFLPALALADPLALIAPTAPATTNNNQIATTAWVKARGIISVLDLGADPTGVADSTTAFNNATATAKAVYVPDGTYKVSTVTINLSGTRLIGAGRFRSTLTSSTTNAPIISVAAGISNIEISDLGFDRLVTPIAGGVGVQFLGFVDASSLSRLYVKNQYTGILLSATGFSQMRDCYITNSLSHGVILNNTAGSGVLQWSLFNNFSQASGGAGFIVATIAGPAGVSLGEWVNTQTFANTLYGVAFIGSAGVPINGVRMNGGFIGEDGNSGVYLDTYSGLHHINNVYVEGEGIGLTGPTLSTAASHIGSGIEITANNTDVTVNNFTGVTNSQDGLRTSASVMTNVIGGRFASNTLFGARFADGTKSAVNGASFAANTSGPVTVTANASSLTAVGNTPSSVDTYNAAVVKTVKVQKFTAGGTYTPSAGMLYAIIECWGGGAAGGSTANTAAGVGSGAGGGGAGSRSTKYSTAAAVGASQTVTIGAAGAAAAAGNNAGGNGGDSSVGALCIGKGGTGGAGSPGNASAAGGLGGVAGTGDVTTTGAPGSTGIFVASASLFIGGGAGASSSVGGGALQNISTGAGTAGSGFASGGSGASSFAAGGASAGGAGTAGLVVITEFCNQ